ncbi:MAG: YfhO family protein, partial [Bacteroidetes bacterium]|nr:YfhO family protein [Bacteroidota bacterium]
SFLLMRYLTKNTLVSLFTALSAAFSTGIIVFLYIGHVTKLTSLCMFPLVFLLLFRMKEKIRLIDFLLLIVTVQLMLQGFHAQIIFYIFFSIAIYFIYFFIRALYKKEKDNQKNLLKTTGLFAVAAIIALLIQADNITQIYQYTPYSTRGGKSIAEKSASTDNPSSSEYYDYHTMWSFSPGEVLTFIVPSYYGFGGSTYEGQLSNNQAVDVNTYFGQMPFVDVAMYMGVIIFILGLFALITRWREPIVQFFGILALISLLISFGKNFPVLFDLLFYHLPYFDKFRVPSMILVLVQLSFPILAGLGLMKIISLKEFKDNRTIKIIKNSAFVFTGLFILSLVLKGTISDWFIGRVSDYTTVIQQSQPQMAQQFTALSSYMSDMFTSDLLIALALLAITFWLAYSYINSKISRDIFAVAVIALTILDLFRIDSRGEKYVDNPDIKNMFNTPDYVTAIKKQNDKEPFRMLNIKQDRSLGSFNNNSNYNAYFMLEDFYGYSGIKPRSYQDLMDVVGPVNQTLWRMLNVKYIVSDQQIPLPGFESIYQQGKEIVYKNDNALPRTYFVDKVESQPDLEVLNDIKANSFDPKNVAFVDGAVPQVNKPDSTATVNISEYKDETMALNVKATGNNFLFFGDTYLPTGWKAYIDGNKTEIYKVNHGFMGIVVPNGQHKVEFVYAPTSFYISKYLALTLSSLVMLGLIFTVLYEIKKSKLAKAATII